ncbi:rab-like protein 3 [Eleutherodactylus coqui]|uniref:rab-like protein 3 n=1 Tax=Eleutherodactylus coqui TaxID=57060 RepID=UPI0034629948
MDKDPIGEQIQGPWVLKKSSLVHLLCHDQVLGNQSWTVGCSVDAWLHEYRERNTGRETFYIELWHVGGLVGSASSMKSTRAVFYNGVNGIVLVHDLTNKKTSQNLNCLSLEDLNRHLLPAGVLVTNRDYDREQFASNQIPLLVIDTKLDQIPEAKQNEALTRTAFLSEDFNSEEINLDYKCPHWMSGFIIVSYVMDLESQTTSPKPKIVKQIHRTLSLVFN